MQRVILVTGATRGIGYAIAQKFLENKDIVYICFKSSFDLANQMAVTYPFAYPIKCDVSNEDEVKEMIAKIKREQGHLDVVVNNAGIALDSTIEDKTVENFQKTLNTNLIGAFLVAKYAKEILEEGSIINIASTNGIDTYYPYSLDYDASKAGLISLTHNLAVAYAPKIRVNAIAPGWINTDMNKDLDEEYIQNEENKILLNRFGEASEIANVAFFLASKEASYINNSVIRVDGGTYVK